MHINFSRLHIYQECPRKYYWRFIRNLVPDRDAPALMLGKAVHLALASHYSPVRPDKEPQAPLVQPLLSPDAQIDTFYDDYLKSHSLLQPEIDDIHKQQAYAHLIYSEYRRIYPTEPFTTLAPEVFGSFELGDHTVHFQTDAPISWRGSVWILEHKTLSPTASLDLFFKRFTHDLQVRVYMHGVRTHLNILPVGVLINVLRKSRKMDSVDLQRDVLLIPEADLNTTIAHFHLQIEELADLHEMSTVPPEGQKPHWFMHTGNCISFNRTCPYFDLCTRENTASLAEFRVREPDYVDEGDHT